MKRIYSYVFAAVAMFAAVSCQKENAIDAPEVNEEAFAITAVANADTKTALVDGVKTYWTSTDALTVFDATASNRKFTTDITENSASAKFTTSTFVLPENLETAMLLAVYPYTEGATTDFSTAITGLELPATQQAVAGGFDSDATIAFALGGLADQHNLKFNNVYGLFEFVVNEDNVKEVAIRANGGEKIAGPVSLALNGTLVAAEGAVSEVTLEGDFVKGSTYYVALIPGTYASGITVSFDGEEVKSTSNEVVLEKNQIRGMGELKLPETSEWSLCGTFNSWGDEVMYKTDQDNFFVRYGITFNEATQFKVRKTGSWNDNYNFGTTTTATKVANSVVGVYTDGGSKNINVNAGTYDIYFDRLAGQVYIMAPGKSYKEAQQPTTTSYYSLAGSFAGGGWDDTVAMKYSGDGIWTNVQTFAANNEFKIKNKGNWDASWGYTNVYPGSGLVSDSGGNAKVKENGTYIVGFYKEGNKITLVKK